jgi:hypothetical protein
MQLVAYGSSFNVLEPEQALRECARVLHSGGSWLALWNHRDIDDPLQREVEAAIRRFVPDFRYGSRRESPLGQVEANGSFARGIGLERRFVAEVSAADWLAAWKSHATLRQQACGSMPALVDTVAAILGGTRELRIPYFTRAWIARRLARP